MGIGKKKEKIPETLKENKTELLKMTKKDQFTAWGQSGEKAQVKHLFCLTSPSRRWFGDENGHSHW